VSAALWSGACGSSPITSSNDLGPALPTPTQPAVVTFRATGPDPQVLQFFAGREVTFVNADSRPREIYGDLHPDHKGVCPEMNLGRLAPGESRKVRASNPSYMLCYYHDESAPADVAQQGLVVFY
jgi:hypothetical protein